MNSKMSSADIKFRYEQDKFEKIRKVLESNQRLSYPDLQFVLALFGVNSNNSIPISSISGDKSFEISRTVYDKNSIDFDSRFGLLTILMNDEKEYAEVVNNLAFQKNGDGRTRYQDLINVSTFYGCFLGGIEPLYELLNKYNIESDVEIFNSLYDLVLESEEEIIKVLEDIEERER